MTSTNQKKLRQRVAKCFPRGRPKLAKLARIIDEATGTAYDEYVFDTDDGAFSSLEIERGRASEYGALHRELLNANADIPADRRPAEALIREAVAAAPKQMLRRVAAVGWQAGNKHFSLHGRVLGADMALLPPRAAKKMRHGPRKSGDLNEWIEMAKLASYSSRLTLALSCAFAAPLLAFSGLQSFGVNLFGRSRAGKSTVALAAGSVVGFGEESQLPSWDVTRAGAQELAGTFNDHLLVMNELGVARSPRKRDAYELARNLTYLFAEGSDATRHSASGYASTRATAVWRVVFLSTSENSITSLAEEAGLQRDEGEYARLWDVPAVHGDKATIFGGRPAGASLDWEAKTLAKIRKVCREHHGVALAPYIEHLLSKRRETLKSEISDAIEEFEARVGAGRLSGAVAHAAKNFGVIYAGGVQAIDATLLPMRKAHLLTYIARCFTAGLETVSTAEAQDARARKAFKKATAQIKWITVSGPQRAWPKLSPTEKAGYRYVANRRRSCALPSDTFDRLLPDTRLRFAVLRILWRSRTLIAPKGKDPERSGFTHESYETFIKVKGRNQRFIRFFDVEDD